MFSNKNNSDDTVVVQGVARGRAAGAVSIAALAAQMRGDERGQVAVTFGLMVVPCIMMLGCAIDLGRMLHAKSQMQGIIDNMALTAGRAVQHASTGSNYTSIAQAAATEYWNANKQNLVMAIPNSEKVTVTAKDAAMTKFNVHADVWVTTPFMTTIAITEVFLGGPRAPQEDGAPTQCQGSAWNCQKVSTEASVVLQAGGNNKDTSIETSLMLDVTGSMDGQKIIDLKLAAKDLIDIVVWNDQSKVTSKVALAPFAESINAGEVLADDVRGPYAGFINGISPTDVTGYRQFKFKKYNSSSTSTFRLSKHCVSERHGTERYTDASPAVAKLGPVYQTTNEPNGAGTGGGCQIHYSTDPEINQIMPLSSDKTKLKARIDKFKVGGATAGQLGTAWAWYLISPNWASYFPANARPGAYDDSKIRKIAVLMTDGDYNMQFWNGVFDRNANTKHANGSSPNGSASSQASSLCTNMKAKGIEVYSVGFQVSNAAKTMLTNCATSTKHYYDASSGESLRMAFRDIALRISSIRIEE